MTNIEQKIKKLREQGLSYNAIATLVGCSKSNVIYYCSPTGKLKNRERRRKYNKKCHPYLKKYEYFIGRKQKTTNCLPMSASTKSLIRTKIRRFTENKMNIKLEDIINHIGTNPKCYLTGESIDINKPRTYQFDHIIPVSRGGTNTIDNLGICTKEANMAKSSMTPDEFINLCKRVLQNFNYKIERAE